MWMCLDRITDIQILPCADLIAHEYSEDCICGPEIERFFCEDGSVHTSMVVHASLDGRELSE